MMGTGEGKGKQRTIREIVDVRRHPTVVRLEELAAPESQWISEAYHQTPEVEAHLLSFRRLLERDSGIGCFVIGHYGSGKSHFLAYLVQQISEGRFVENAPAAVPVSLLNFRAEMPLEEILCGVFGMTPTGQDRRLMWEEIGRKHPQGIVLLVDEVSEFLRSKADARSFTEDVRFLQFLGEWAQDRRFWIVAAMQEQIEHTGDLEYSLYRKIKDRFPLRYLLSPAHVEDLVKQSILLRKPGYEAAVSSLVAPIREALPGHGVLWDALESCYPLHPETLRLLADVRERFSQARGVVDFVTTRLAGDPARDVAPFLDQPLGAVLTPDTIVDHFADLFEVQPEFLPLSQSVLPYFRLRIGEIFETSAQQDLAWRLVKLLILVHLASGRREIRPNDAAAWLLSQTSKIDPERNVAIVQRLLGTLVREGRYVEERSGAFRLVPEDEGFASFDRLLEKEMASLRQRDDMVFEAAMAVLEKEGPVPFSLPRERWQNRQMRWCFHERAYNVYFGRESPPSPPEEGVGLCIRLPWGTQDPVPGVYTLVPKQLTPGPPAIELAALVRLKERSWGEAVRRKIEVRIGERAALLRAQFVGAYQSAVIVDPQGRSDAAPRSDPRSPLKEWLDELALWIHRRLFPGFERHAPSHGPLPREAFLAFAREELGERTVFAEGHEYVQLVREAYLVPMGLLRRQGRGYQRVARLEKHEVVSLVLEILSHQPPPSAVYSRLEAPVLGLVPDQISLLLVFLLAQGDLEILKGKRSYRELFESYPDPRHYDQLSTGRSLAPAQVRDLTHLCEGLGVKLPDQWTPANQRRIIRRLREEGRSRKIDLGTGLGRVQAMEGAGNLAKKLALAISQFSALEDGEDEFELLERFLREIESPSRFLALVMELRDLPLRLETLGRERQRFAHLLNELAEAGMGHGLGDPLGALGEAPTLDSPDELERWLRRVREAYDAYKQDYGERHAAWWREQAGHPGKDWSPPGIASCRLLGLSRSLEEFAAAKDRLAKERCRELSNLDFRPRCACGFDGKRAPYEASLETFESLRRGIESALQQYFREDAVKAAVQAWAEEAPAQAGLVRDYLEGQAPYPGLEDAGELSAYLETVDTRQEVDPSRLLSRLTDRSWTKKTLLLALESWLEEWQVERFRFAPFESDGNEVFPWCGRQAMSHGEPLPDSLGLAAREAIASSLRQEWVGDKALGRLTELGLGEQGEDRVVSWILDQSVACPKPAGTWDPLVEAARETIHPSHPGDPMGLARQAALLYSQHHRMMRLAREKWLSRVDALAAVELADPLPSWPEVASSFEDASWLLIDSLGLPLLSALDEALDEVLPQWQRAPARFALVGPSTSTRAFHDMVVAEGMERPYEKISVVDELLHRRFLPFGDLTRLVTIELAAALRGLADRLDPSRPLLVFADHGFRLGPDGRSYRHGGSSTLERIVPLVLLETR